MHVRVMLRVKLYSPSVILKGLYTPKLGSTDSMIDSVIKKVASTSTTVRKTAHTRAVPLDYRH